MPALGRVLGDDFTQVASSSTSLGALYSDANVPADHGLGSGVAQGAFSSASGVQGLRKSFALGASSAVAYVAWSLVGCVLQLFLSILTRFHFVVSL